MSKCITFYNGDDIVAILHCDTFKEEIFGNMKLVNLYKLGYDEAYEISYNIYIGNIWCTHYEIKEVDHG